MGEKCLTQKLHHTELLHRSKFTMSLHLHINLSHEKHMTYATCCMFLLVQVLFLTKNKYSA